MIVVTRQKDEQIVIEIPGCPVTMTVLDIREGRCRLGFTGDLQDIPIYCKEIFDATGTEAQDGEDRCTENPLDP